MRGRAIAICGAGLLILVGSTGGWWLSRPAPPEPMPEALPLPPFPPRIASDDGYERCLALLAEDPAGADAMAAGWRAEGGGEGAPHCLALARIAEGQAADGAALLERFGNTGAAAERARALVLSQAAQARLLAEQPEQAFEDAAAALALAPDDISLLIFHALVAARLDRPDTAIADLTQALRRDGGRMDALVLRAATWRGMNRLDLAAHDIEQATALNPEDPEALLERGIQRHRAGDVAGARTDWQRARRLDPLGAVAELADQNLALLEATADRP